MKLSVVHSHQNGTVCLIVCLFGDNAPTVLRHTVTVSLFGDSSGFCSVISDSFLNLILFLSPILFLQ